MGLLGVWLSRFNHCTIIIILLITASVRRHLIAITIISIRTLGVLNHDLLMSQLLNRALIFISDSLQAMLHSITLLLATPIITTIIDFCWRSLVLTIAWWTLSTRMHLRLWLFSDKSRRSRPSIVIVITIALLRTTPIPSLWFVSKDCIMAFPEITLCCVMPSFRGHFRRAVSGSCLWISLISSTCNWWFTSNRRSRIRRFHSILIHY